MNLFELDGFMKSVLLKAFEGYYAEGDVVEVIKKILYHGDIDRDRLADKLHDYAVTLGSMKSKIEELMWQVSDRSI